MLQQAQLQIPLYTSISNNDLVFTGGNTINNLTNIYSYQYIEDELIGKVIYVRSTMHYNTPTGESWNTGFYNLHDALSVAAYGDEIWVEEGVYRVSESDDSAESFQVNANEIKIVGGFNRYPHETRKSQRDHISNPTVISGDLGVQGDSSDDSRQIFNVSSSNITLDGLIIESTSDFGLPAIQADSIILFNSVLKNHKTRAVSANHATVNACIFESNKGLRGAGLYLSENGYIYNSLFVNNESNDYGGAIFITGGTGELHVNHSSFYNNTALQDGGAISAYVPNQTIKNSIFYQNQALGDSSDNSDVLDDYSGALSIEYSIIGNGHNGFSGSGVFNQDPVFSNPSSVIGRDGLFFTNDDGFRLQNNSPAHGIGDNDIYGKLSEDIRGIERYLPKDLGPYEGVGSSHSGLMLRNTSFTPPDAIPYVASGVRVMEFEINNPTELSISL